MTTIPPLNYKDLFVKANKDVIKGDTTWRVENKNSDGSYLVNRDTKLSTEDIHFDGINFAVAELVGAYIHGKSVAFREFKAVELTSENDIKKDGLTINFLQAVSFDAKGEKAPLHTEESFELEPVGTFSIKSVEYTPNNLH